MEKIAFDKVDHKHPAMACVRDFVTIVVDLNLIIATSHFAVKRLKACLKIIYPDKGHLRSFGKN